MSEVAVLALLTACGGDDSGGGAVVPLGEAAVEITAIRSSDGMRFDRDEFDEVSLSCDGSLSVFLSFEEWTLRPPGACAGLAQCGSVRLTINDGELVRSSAGTRVGVEALDLADPHSEHQLEAQLIDDTGQPYLFEEEPVGDQVSATFLAAEGCDGGGAGAGGQAGAGGHAGAAGLAGMGGDGG
jgi:hypothetical protein